MTAQRQLTVLSENAVDRYRTDGFVVLEDTLPAAFTAEIREEFERLCGLDHPGRVFEKDGSTVRGIHGSHQVSPFFARLVRHPSLLLAAEQLIGSQVYVHQFKINAKRALTGDVWPWHQDYTFWQQKDGMRESRAVNVALFLDEVTEHNGPLLVMPGSQRIGTVSSERQGVGVGAGGADWASSLSADLDLALDAERLTFLADRYGIRSVTGAAGGILLFNPEIIHGSGVNMSPHDRGMALITYNSVDNSLPEVDRPRPEFLASRDFQPLTPLLEEI